MDSPLSLLILLFYCSVLRLFCSILPSPFLLFLLVAVVMVVFHHLCSELDVQKKADMEDVFDSLLCVTS